MIQGMFTQSPDTLAAFGLKAPQAGKKTVATKAQALVKSEATRQARHTMGKRQKGQIKGEVPATGTQGPAPAPTAGTQSPAPTPTTGTQSPAPTPPATTSKPVA